MNTDATDPGDVLSIDLGNTRCKLRLWRRGSASPLDAKDFATEAAADREVSAELSVWLAACAPQHCVLSTVAGKERVAQWRALVERGARRPVRTPDPGLVNETRTPETVGLDRLFAARGAWELVRSGAVVADAGTALTVDALVVEGGGPPRFAGGAIAPGPELMASALSLGGAALPEFEPDPKAPALGHDTPGALRAGVSVGFVGLCARLVEEVAEEAGLGSAPLVLTGGGARYLLRPGLFGARTVRHEPELVHRGLVAAALPGFFAAPAGGATA